MMSYEASKNRYTRLSGDCETGPIKEKGCQDTQGSEWNSETIKKRKTNDSVGSTKYTARDVQTQPGNGEVVQNQIEKEVEETRKKVKKAKHDEEQENGGHESYPASKKIKWKKLMSSILKYIKEFNDLSSEFRVFILSTRAGGLGINLTAADTCILMKLEHVVIGKGHFQQERNKNSNGLEEEDLLALLWDDDANDEDRLIQTEISDEDLERVIDRKDLIIDPPEDSEKFYYPLKGPGWELVVPTATGGVLSNLKS